MKFFKVLSVFACIVSAASLAGNGYLYQQWVTEKMGREESESHLLQADEKNAFLQSAAEKASQLEEEVDNLRQQIKGYAAQRDAAKKEVDRVSQEAGELRKRLKQIEDEKNQLSQELNLGEITEKAITQEATKLASSPAVALGAALPVPIKAAGQAPVKKEETLKAADPRPSQVLSVNRQFNFVVVNIGIRDKVKIGDALRVEEGGKLIGRIQVEKLYENFSACAILEEDKTARIKEGDLVRHA